ncbi:MAG: MFS transporter [Candidatus Kapaibacterium sp.]
MNIFFERQVDACLQRGICEVAFPTIYSLMKKHSETYLVIATLWLLVFVAASQIIIVAPILPRIAEELSIEKSALGLLLTAYAISAGVFALVAGPISDRFGRRRILLAGSGFLAVTLGLHGLADSFLALLIVRLLTGVAGGLLSGAVVSYIGDYFPAHRRGWASGWAMSGAAAGQTVGIFFGSLLASWFGFRAPFLCFAIIAAAAFLLIWLRLPQPEVRLSASLSFRSSLTGYASLLRRSDVRVVATIWMTTLMAISIFGTFFPIWLEEDLAFTAFLVSLLYGIGGVATVLVGPWAGKVSDRIRRTNVIIGASIGIALLIPAIALVEPPFSWAIYPLYFLIMAFAVSRRTPLQALMTQMATGEHRGSLMSLVLSMSKIGFGIGSALASGVWHHFGFIGNAMVATASVFLMIAIVWRYLRDIENGLLLEERKSEGESGVDPSTHLSLLDSHHG